MLKLFKSCCLIIGLTLLGGCSAKHSNDNQKGIKKKKKEKQIASPRIVIHGGAGSMQAKNMTEKEQRAYKKKLKQALNKGYQLLSEGKSSSTVVVQVIQVLEQSPLFNSGIGAVFTHDGKNELDASIMNGKTGMAGGVAGVSHIKSPILAAYTVMKKSKHVLLSGAGAEAFARQEGLNMVDSNYFYTEKRYQRLQKVLGKEQRVSNKKTDTTASLINIQDRKYGTVGAVVLDKNGNISAGTSTGGMTNKRFGRIGDSPLIGAGTYADNATCGVSSTGHGEFFMRNLVAYDIAARMKYQNKGLKEAADEVIHELKKIDGSGGVIAMDQQGNIVMSFNTKGMFRGSIQEKNKAQVSLFGQK